VHSYVFVLFCPLNLFVFRFQFSQYQFETLNVPGPWPVHTEAEILEIEPEWPKTGSPAYKNIRAAAQAARERVCLVTFTRIFCLYFVCFCIFNTCQTALSPTNPIVTVFIFLSNQELAREAAHPPTAPQQILDLDQVLMYNTFLAFFVHMCVHGCACMHACIYV
jgi:hypothetical protein